MLPAGVFTLLALYASRVPPFPINRVVLAPADAVGPLFSYAKPSTKLLSAIVVILGAYVVDDAPVPLLFASTVSLCFAPVRSTDMPAW